MISQLAPLTNILMDLNEEQLREVLFEVASWDTSGKDLFDFDLGFDDPIEVTIFASEATDFFLILSYTLR